MKTIKEKIEELKNKIKKLEEEEVKKPRQVPVSHYGKFEYFIEL